MAQTQIFISHSSADKAFTDKLYDALLADGYWVWMDKSLQPAEKWEPQIDEKLRMSKIFLVLFSSTSVTSDWVKHEGSMALALNQQIIPVKIDPYSSDLEQKLPIWAKPIQLHKLFEGSADYDDQYLELKQLLGKPLPVRQYLIQMLKHYQESGMLLDEVALALIDKHYNQLNLTRAQQLIADELIQESRFRLASYWIRYEKLRNALDLTRTEYLTIKQENRGLQSDVILRNFLLVIFVIAFLILFFLFLSDTYFHWQSVF
jgi:TIR domain-containing protein